MSSMRIEAVHNLMPYGLFLELPLLDQFWQLGRATVILVTRTELTAHVPHLGPVVVESLEIRLSRRGLAEQLLRKTRTNR